MKEVKFSFGSYRLMDPFWERLQKALKNLPNNPKPGCEGFYLAWYCFGRRTLIVEKIGIVPEEKDFKYLHFATKKVTQTLLFKKIRSKEFENNDLEQYPGGINILNGCGGTSGHESMVDEAVSALWLTACHLVWKHYPTFIEERGFWSTLALEAGKVQDDVAPDNKWISIIAELMKNLS